MKKFALITSSQLDFNVFKLENQYSVNKSNSVKMPNVGEIIKTVEQNINQLN